MSDIWLASLREKCRWQSNHRRWFFMYCPTCGSDNQVNVRFCRRCGTSLEAVSLALKRQDEDRPLEKSQLSQLIKSYYSGRHEMIFGLSSTALGIAIPAVLLGTGYWGLFWIFVWI